MSIASAIYGEFLNLMIQLITHAVWHAPSAFRDIAPPSLSDVDFIQLKSSTSLSEQHLQYMKCSIRFSGIDFMQVKSSTQFLWVAFAVHEIPYQVFWHRFYAGQIVHPVSPGSICGT
jgi:hypothetical protein